MYTEEGVSTQHSHVPVLEIEGSMRNYGRGIDGGLVIGGNCDCGVDGRFVIRNVCDGEVGQTGSADGRRVSDGSNGKRRNWVWL